MRELVLVFPDLQPLPEGASATAPDPLQWRFAAARPLRGGWRAALAHQLERDDLAFAAPAEIVAAAAGFSAGEWWLATPMHWQAGMTSLFVPADALLHPSTEEAAEIATEFAATFGADGLALVPVAGGHWLLRGLATEGADAPEPERLLGTTLDHAVLQGAGAATLRAFGSEIEMWLHGLPLNRRREQAGLPRICALWFWGGGVMRRDGIVASRRTADAHASATLFCSADPWLRAACQLAARECVWPAADAVTAIENMLRATAPRSVFVGAFDRAGYEFAIEALRSGAITRLTVLGSDRATELAATDRYRLWRPLRSLLEALA